MVLSFLNSMQLAYVMYAYIPSDGFSIRPSYPYKPAISVAEEAMVNQLQALKLGL